MHGGAGALPRPRRGWDRESMRAGSRKLHQYGIIHDRARAVGEQPGVPCLCLGRAAAGATESEDLVPRATGARV